MSPPPPAASVHAWPRTRSPSPHNLASLTQLEGFTKIRNLNSDTDSNYKHFEFQNADDYDNNDDNEDDGLFFEARPRIDPSLTINTTSLHRKVSNDKSLRKKISFSFDSDPSSTFPFPIPTPPSSTTTSTTSSLNGDVSEGDVNESSKYEENEKSESESKNKSKSKPTVEDSTSIVSSVKDVSTHWFRYLCSNFMLQRDPTAYYSHLLEVATNYAQYEAAARALDMVKGLEDWKKDPKSPHYDWKLLRDRLIKLSDARKQAEEDPSAIAELVFQLRTSISRGIGDMGRPELYGYTHIGTKILIEDYISEVSKDLQTICDSPETPEWTLQDKYDHFLSLRQSFGRTALLLSGGASLGLNHIGVIKALLDTNLLPRVISGASSGSIIASLVCTKTDEEFPALLGPGGMELNFFSSESPVAHLLRFYREGYLYDAKSLADCVKKNIGEITFQEAFNRTRRILNITVSSGSGFEMPRLLNYLTAPNVLIWSAVAASCAVPLVFNSTPIYAKDRFGKEELWNAGGGRWIDGSVENDLPMNKLAELFNVNHFIVCQVNPHIIPFVQRSLTPSRLGRATSLAFSLARSEILHRLGQLQEFNVFPTLTARAQAIVSQRYYGDITIIPEISPTEFIFLLTNPTREMMVEGGWRGERATWPKISIIRNHLQVELTIDRIILALKLRRLDEQLEAITPTSAKSDPTTTNHGFKLSLTPVVASSEETEPSGLSTIATTPDPKEKRERERKRNHLKLSMTSTDASSPSLKSSSSSSSLNKKLEGELKDNHYEPTSELQSSSSSSSSSSLNSLPEQNLDSKEPGHHIHYHRSPNHHNHHNHHYHHHHVKVKHRGGGGLKKGLRNSRSTSDVRAWDSDVKAWDLEFE